MFLYQLRQAFMNLSRTELVDTVGLILTDISGGRNGF